MDKRAADLARVIFGFNGVFATALRYLRILRLFGPFHACWLQLGGLRDFGAESCGFRLSRSFHVVFLIVHGLAVRWRVLLRCGHARLIDWVYIEVFTL